tara:strand:- start:37420 stop:38595 length:1176 start_codon:yes stop_codon:yes gene_type:complete
MSKKILIKKKRKVLCVTGTRADYPRIKSVLREIKKSDKLHLSLVVTGSHLLKEYGSSINEIINDKHQIDDKIYMFKGDYNSPKGMLKAVARCISGFADTLTKIKPDIVLLTVDRIETMALAVSASLMNFPIAHVQGGEVTGTIDESIRHAVTKLSHIHFPSTKDAALRIKMMGELPSKIFKVGCPYIDEIKFMKSRSRRFLAKKYNLDYKRDFIIFTQHAVTTEFKSASNQIKITLDALKKFKDLQIIAFYSNTDAGGKEIISEILKQKNFRVIPNMDSKDFLSLMSHSSVMVGNSSAAIREAPSFGLPAVNIGSRQNGRLRAKNIIDVPHKSKLIVRAINKCLKDKAFRRSVGKSKNPYGDGNSAQRIVKILEKIKLDNKLIQKRINYEL